MDNIKSKLLKGIEQLVDLQYRLVLYVDMETKEVSVLKAKEDLLQYFENTKYEDGLSGWFASFAECELCHPADRYHFMEFSNPDYLDMRLKASGDGYFGLRYRRKHTPDDYEYHQYDIDIITSKDEAGKDIAFVFISSADAHSACQKKNVLVIDDSDTTRKLLSELLKDSFHIFEAKDGQEGLQVLKDHYRDISLILLDLMMPVCDGYEFMERKATVAEYSKIPVVAITSETNKEAEIKCLKLGISDFLEKPFDNDIVLSRIRNALRLKESAEALERLEYEPVTGLMTKRAFYARMDSLLKEKPKQPYTLIFVNVDHFKHVNERYGERIANAVLKHIGSEIQTLPDFVCGARFVADHFAILLEQNSILNCDLFDDFADRVKRNAPISALKLDMGIYPYIDHNQSVSVLCDRANLAEEMVKNQYDKNYALFDEEMGKHLEKEQIITDCMEKALKEDQFKVYYQPKHDAKTGKIMGAEALIRWIHPEMGFMSPGEFIPLFEKNGFISKVDYYVWNRTCANQKRWKEKGLPVVPISVNASRKDFFSRSYMEKMSNSVEDNKIAPELMHVEITETLYTENSDDLIVLVRQLQEFGFKIEMDDFGSGYSSLNMLSELPMDVLKLDLKFMGNLEVEQKKIVLQTCIDLAKDLSLKTVAEGVETHEQKEILKDMGCDYIQGYLYAKPMPEDEFEEYLRTHS